MVTSFKAYAYKRNNVHFQTEGIPTLSKLQICEPHIYGMLRLLTTLPCSHQDHIITNTIIPKVYNLVVKRPTVVNTNVYKTVKTLRNV